MTVSKTARWLPSTKARQDRSTILSGKSPNGAHQQHSDHGKPYATLIWPDCVGNGRQTKIKFVMIINVS